jgi:hypothetical protein
MLDDGLDEALDRFALTPAQVLHLLRQVIEVELLEPTRTQQRGLTLCP